MVQNHEEINVKGLSKSELISFLTKNKNKPIFLNIPKDGINRLESFSDEELIAFSWLESNAHGTAHGPLDIDKRHYKITENSLEEDCPLLYIDSEIVRKEDREYKTLNRKLQIGGLSVI